MDAESKWTIIHTWKKLGNTSQVARQLGLRLRVVQRWVQRYKETGSVERLPRTGRPPLLDAAAGQAAVELLLSEEQGSASKAAQALKEAGAVPQLVHRETLARHAKAAAKAQGKPITFVRGLPAKQLGVHTKQQRVDFARRNKNRNWKLVMFTDRKKFLFYYPGASVKPAKWVRRGTQYTAPKVNRALGVNLYAGITRYGVTKCHLVAGTAKLKSTHTNKKGEVGKNITASEYREVLEHTLLPQGNRIFSAKGESVWYLQQDNDPTHKRAASEVLESYNNKHGTSIQLLQGWPPNSPDLSPIENVWGIVQAKVNERGCKSFAEFQQAVLDEFQSEAPKHVVKLYASMKHRMAECLAAGGDKIRY